MRDEPQGSALNPLGPQAPDPNRLEPSVVSDNLLNKWGLGPAAPAGSGRSPEAKPYAPETNTIRPIPLDQRHGRPWQLFTVWFGCNVNLLTITTGALASTVFHLDLTLSLAALLIGNLFGGLFMALHAAQGPKLGVPQMVQTRGQFGSLGSIFVILVVVFMYVGFLGTNMVLATQSMRAFTGLSNSTLAMSVMGAATLIATVYGHDLIHRAAIFATGLSCAALLVCLAILLVVPPPAVLAPDASWSASNFLGAVSLGVLWQIAYAPYVSDYSRYLPPDTGPRQAFTASYWGSVIGSAVPMGLGAYAGLHAAGGDIPAMIASRAGFVGPATIIVLTGCIIVGNAMNLYCGMLSTLTVIQNFRARWVPGALSRWIAAIALLLVGTAMALFAANRFMSSYSEFLSVLLYVLTPWTAINLVDYYLVRKGDYVVEEFFAPDGGRYGRYNIPALSCFLLGIVVQAPFVATPLYTGPAARMLHGADLSWLAGLLVVAPIYWLAARTRG